MSPILMTNAGSMILPDDPEDLKKMIKAETEATVWKRLRKVKDVLGNTLKKSATNLHFGNMYVLLPDLLDIVEPELAKHNFLLFQPTYDTGRNGTVGIRTLIIDELSGETVLSGDLALPCDATNPQKATSAVTYGRRTCINSLLALAEKDDDGNEASAKSKKLRPKAGAKSDPQGDIFD